MKTKEERIKDGIERMRKLKDEVILRYTEEIDFDFDLSLYNVMMQHFVNGDLDDVFLTDVTDGMSDEEKQDLFDLVRKYNGLCFAYGDTNSWLRSVENTYISDFDLISNSIFDSYDYLLSLAKLGGESVLKQLTALRENDKLNDVAVVGYLRDSFVDDRILTAILLDMSDGKYDMFSNEQKGSLLKYPEGTLYFYGDDAIKIISPVLLACRMYNDFYSSFSDDLIIDVTDDNSENVMRRLKKFFDDEDIDFEDTVLILASKYKNSFENSGIVLNNEMMKVIYDSDGSDIQDAWNTGDEVLGGTFDSWYGGETK